MYQSPGSMEYTAAYQQSEALRYVAHRQLERQVDQHTSAQHRVVAAAVALLLVLVVVLAI